MSRHALKYGDSECFLDVPDGCLAAEVLPNAVDLPSLPPAEVVRRALREPVDSPTLEAIVKPGDKVCIVIPDISRLWQSPQVYVPEVVAALSACGIPDADMTLLVATGAHRRHTPEEHARLVSADVAGRIRIVDHQCREDADLVQVGTTSRGTPIVVNKTALEADKIILCGGVVFHFLAGFGGGPKMLVPGICGYETIQRHHHLAFNAAADSGTNPLVRAGILEDNIFQADLAEGAALLKPCFSLNVITNAKAEIIAAFAGQWLAAHRAACALVDRMDRVDIARRTPLVVASAGGAPRDMNVFQEIKLLSNALAAVEEGGTMILLARNPDGFGNAETERQLTAYPDHHAREAALRETFSIGGYVGFLLAEAAERHNVILMTDMDPALFVSTRLHVVPSLDKALELAAGFHGGSLAVPTTVMPQGAVTLPRVVG